VVFAFYNVEVRFSFQFFQPYFLDISNKNKGYKTSKEINISAPKEGSEISMSTDSVWKAVQLEVTSNAVTRLFAA
jgi:hypothetical protein